MGVRLERGSRDTSIICRRVAKLVLRAAFISNTEAAGRLVGRLVGVQTDNRCYIFWHIHVGIQGAPAYLQEESLLSVGLCFRCGCGKMMYVSINREPSLRCSCMYVHY